MLLVLAEVVYHLAIHGEHALTGDVALEVITAVDNREPVGLGILEHAHDTCHRCGVTQDGSWFHHELRGLEMMVQFGTEHYVADFHDVDLA